MILLLLFFKTENFDQKIGDTAAWLRYDAWGVTRSSSGTTLTDKRYTGQYEAEAGIYFYQSRFYDPQLGRFVQADTIIPEAGDPMAWDRYAYVNNNPIRFNDPSGHCPECLVMGGIMGIGALIGYGTQVYNNFQNGLTGFSAFYTNIQLEPIWKGAVIAGGVALASTAVVTAISSIGPTIGALTGAACADGDCTNEGNNIVQTLGSGFKNSDLRFSQKTASPRFSAEGAFNGETIGTLAEKIRSGKIDPSEIKIDFVQRGTIKLIENTRSSLSLLRAGISPEKWNLVNKTGNQLSENNITERLIRNGLTNFGTLLIRITGLGKNISNLE